MNRLKIILIAGLMIFGFLKSNGQKYKITQIVNGEKVEIDYSDFHDLRNNDNYEEFHLGKILVTSGQFVITDPFLLYNPHPLEKTVDTGQYDMYLYFHDCDMGYRVAYAVIEFDNKTPITWECALSNDSLLEGMDKTTNGLFPVDAGLLCVSDKETFKAYDDFYNDFVKKNPDGNIYNDHFAGEFAKNGNNPEGTYKDGDWINYQIDKDHNIILFSSGLGDGLYPAYWGIDENGKPLKLLVDLLVVERLGKSKKRK